MHGTTSTLDPVSNEISNEPIASHERFIAERDALVRLAECFQFDRILVTTTRSLYELIVVCGSTGAVMVRGGSFFPTFTDARVVGSTAGGSAVEVGTICVGLHLELTAGSERIVTSKVQTIERVRRSDAIPSARPGLPLDVA